MLSKSVVCLWVSAAVFVVHVSMHTWLCLSVLRNHVETGADFPPPWQKIGWGVVDRATRHSQKSSSRLPEQQQQQGRWESHQGSFGA